MEFRLTIVCMFLLFSCLAVQAMEKKEKRKKIDYGDGDLYRSPLYDEWGDLSVPERDDYLLLYYEARLSGYQDMYGGRLPEELTPAEKTSDDYHRYHYCEISIDSIKSRKLERQRQEKQKNKQAKKDAEKKNKKEQATNIFLKTVINKKTFFTTIAVSIGFISLYILLHRSKPTVGVQLAL